MNEIMTWRERIGQPTDFPLHAPTDVERAMEAEIRELRAQVDHCVCAVDLLRDALEHYNRLAPNTITAREALRMTSGIANEGDAA